jgi:spore germination protein GerM
LIKAGNDDGSGVATIELSPGFFEQVPPQDQLLAIGQIVLTVTEVGGIGQVLFTQGGNPLGVPRGPSGGLSDGKEPLSRRDYQELLNPPVPTTTTSTTTTVATTTV